MCQIQSIPRGSSFWLWKSLEALHMEMKWGGDTTVKQWEKRRRLALVVWNFAHTLWRLAYSQVLLYHLKVLHSAGRLILPMDFEGDTCLDTLCSVPFAFDSSTKDSENDQVKEDDQFHKQINQSEPDALVFAFRRWLHLQASPFVVLSILSSFSHCPETPPLI